jgi:thiamine biosynthesis protein ThiS
VIVTVNGEPRECPGGASLAQFIEHLQLKGDRVAVELNQRIATRNRWAETLLHEGDRLEIVHFVGGGSEDSQM